MGEDTCIYVHKKDLEKVGYFTTEKINNLLKGRWYYFKDKFNLDEYPQAGFFTAQDILSNIAGKKLAEDYVNIIRDLMGCDCIIQGDYSDFPKDKNEDDYIDLTIIFYKLFDELLEKCKEVATTELGGKDG